DDVADGAFEVKGNENDVHVFANESDKTDKKKHDKKAKRDDKGKSLVDSIKGIRNLRAEFKGFSFNSTNSPSINAVSPNFRIAGQSLFVSPSIGFMRPFGCHVTILNTLDSLEKFDGKADKGFLVGYSINCKAFRVFNSRTRIVQGTLHINFLENKPNVAGIGPKWLFDIDTLTMSMNYQHVVTGNQPNDNADVKSASTPIEIKKPLLKDPDGEDVDVHLYRSMIGSFMYLTSSRPEIMFTVCACAIFQVTPKVSCLHAVKRIFRRLSIGCGLISWQCKKQTVVSTSSTEAEYVAAASCCAQALWIQNQLLDCGPEQMTSGKDLSNLLIADSLLKAIWHFITAISYELMLFGLMKVDAVNLMLLDTSDVQLQALIDDKKVVVTEAIIRRDLHLDDADGVQCLPNAEIFEELARMGYEKPHPKLAFFKAFTQWKFLIHTIVQCISSKGTAWNEFSNSMASAIICLAIGRKFNFSKYIFDSMVRNVDSPRCIQTRGKIVAIDADEGTTLVDAETDEEVALDTESQERTNLNTNVHLVKENVNAASKGVSAVIAPELVSTVEPTMFDDEDVTMTMAQTLIKLKAEKARILDEKIAQKLHDEEVQKVATRDEQERADMEKALELQRQLDEREDAIDWSAVAEQVKERQSDSIKRYQDLKKKPISVAQSRKNMMIYLKNMAGYLMEFFKGMTYDEIRPIFEREAAEVSGSESTQEIPTDDTKEITKEDVQNMLEIVPVSEFRVKALQVTDMSKVDKNEAKRTKPGTGMKRVQEIKAEGEFISNLISLILYPK
nr:hypothetical protein [Tanacetum cinerariifolium]